MAPDEAEAGPIDKAFLDLPESVAARINSGDLDMRPEARAERQADLYPTLTYHGGGDDIYEIDPDRVKYGKTADTGFFMSTSQLTPQAMRIALAMLCLSLLIPAAGLML